ncbi:RNA 2',3'-cyclic phosphodiesterase [Rufibacter quisquiliarum]|uniref:RNA 2',3'-cyclic phosphodiesterase n=1 Tax=Rufibacter quisquiliarum TaxID=1549639 RepID=A0A839GXI2_9BACT|nr:RNA 2',3'-cyclic phosphodiesterase [Rufibacter quisquiliarum]MBA9079547.1 2'-5' RNA ligase [Rufibacter quisquiliarum]
MMQETLRLFVAAALPQDLKEYLVQARQAYDEPGIRAVPTENLHLTLFFLGNVAGSALAHIRQTLTQVAQRYEPFVLTLEQVEPVPKRTAPRLIWARFEPHPGFTQLSRELTQLLSATPPKQEKFIPHITLCRFRKDLPVPAHLPLVTPDQKMVFPVNTLALWQSQLASPHPVYTIMESFWLGGT